MERRLPRLFSYPSSQNDSTSVLGHFKNRISWVASNLSLHMYQPDQERGSQTETPKQAAGQTARQNDRGTGREADGQIDRETEGQ